MLVIGAENSSNSKRLVEVALRQGCDKAALIARASAIDWRWLDGVGTLGITAGASAPEVLVDEVVQACSERYDVLVQEVEIAREDVVFKLPKVLAQA